MPVFLLVGVVIAAVLGTCGLSLSTTARPRWPRFVAVEPARARRWRGAALLWLAPSVVCLATSWQVGPIAAMEWLVAANATLALAWACILLGELVRVPDERSRSQGPPTLALGVLLLIGGGAGLVMAAANPREFIGALGYAGPQMPVGALAIAVGLRLRKLSPPRRGPADRAGWTPPPWHASPPPPPTVP